MGSIPTKRLINLYDKAIRNSGKFVKDREFELMITDSGDVVLIHYGTVICRNIKGNADIGGAYSKTDRDYINGIIRLMKLPGYAYIRDYNLYFNDGKKGSNPLS